MANVLPLDKRVQILNMLVEGVSMRAISRMAGCSINTVSKMLEDAGEVCLDLHDQLVTHVKARQVQCDEIWSFCCAKQKNVATAKAAPAEAGDVWTWTALDAKVRRLRHQERITVEKEEGYRGRWFTLLPEREAA